MADDFKIYVDEKDLKECAQWLDKFGTEMTPLIQWSMDWATVQIANHAKSNHFFVGVGKGSTDVARANVFTFTNPDGTPRFKVHTGNLRNSIQPMRATKEGNVIIGQVNAGMEYAQKVEEGLFGVREGGFPFMRPALEAVREPFLKHLISNIKSFVKERGGKDS
jgi:hypothetical protein